MPFSLLRSTLARTSEFQLTRQQYRQRLLTYILLGLLGVNVIYLLLSLLDGEHRLDDVYNLMLAIAPFVLGALLWLNVQGYVRIVGPALLVLLSAAVFVTALAEETPRYVDNYLYYHIIGIIVARLLFSYRGVMLYSITLLFGVGIMLVTYDDTFHDDLLNVLTYLSIVIIVFLALTHFMDRVEALRQAELEKRIQSQDQLLLTAFDGVVILDKTFTTVESSPAFATLLGYQDTAQLTGQQVFTDTFPPVVSPGWMPLFETEAHRANGTMIHLEATYRAEGAYIIAAVRDISQRWEQRQLLIQRAAYFLALHETALALMHYQDYARILTQILQSATPLLGTRHGFVALFEDEQQQVRLRAGTGIFEEQVATIMPRRSGLVQRILDTHHPVVIDDFASWRGVFP
jgi:PAS domain-containing protein